MTTTTDYTFETLKPMNSSYLSEHFIHQSDVDKINMLVYRIEAMKQGNPVPGEGDILICQFPDGRVKTERAHIEHNSFYEDKLSVCVDSYVPFIDPQSLLCNTSGGPWFAVEHQELEYVGKQQKMFKAWGHMGMCGNGAIYFQAEVNVWKLVDTKNRIY